MEARREVINTLINFGIPKDLLSLEKRILDTIKIVESYLKTDTTTSEKISIIKKAIEEIVVKYEMDGAKKTSLIPGAKELLTYLKNHEYKIGLFTLENSEVTKYILERFSISHFFDSVVTRDDIINPKPHPDHLRKVLEQLEVSAHETIVVGDNPVDIECGKRINAIKIARLSARHSKDELFEAGADYVIENLLKIKEILGKIL